MFLFLYFEPQTLTLYTFQRFRLVQETSNLYGEGKIKIIR